MSIGTERFVFDRLPSPVGRLLLACDEAGRLCALDFHDDEARLQRLVRLHHGQERPELVAGRVPAHVAGALEAFFAGELGAIDGLAVRTGGSGFRRRVWGALRLIPAGTTTSYGRLAAAIGSPGASRAVGLANGANPVAIVVPCHRVIGADGTLTGYGGGLERKRWLLEHEQRWRAARPAPPEEQPA